MPFLQRLCRSLDSKNNILRDAVARNDLRATRHAIEIGADDSLKTALGIAMLFDGAAKHDLGAVRFAIEIGVDVEVKNAEGRTPLHVAASQGKEEIVQMLVSAQSNLNAQEENKRTRLTPLHLAAQKGYPEIVRILLKGGAERDSRDCRGRTPLYYAVSHRHEETVRILLEYGADTAATDSAGEQIFDIAATAGSASIIALLIANGADPNTKMKTQETPLHWAVSKGRVDVVEILLNHGADRNAQNGKSETPLHIAASSGFGEIVTILLNASADREARDLHGQTALLAAARAHCEAVIELLLAKGVNKDARDEEDNSWNALLELPAQFTMTCGDCWSYAEKDYAIKMFNKLKAILPNVMSRHQVPEKFCIEVALWKASHNGQGRFKLLATGSDYRPETSPLQLERLKVPDGRVVFHCPVSRARSELRNTLIPVESYDMWDADQLNRYVADCDARIVRYAKILSPFRERKEKTRTHLHDQWHRPSSIDIRWCSLCIKVGKKTPAMYGSDRCRDCDGG